MNTANGHYVIAVTSKVVHQSLLIVDLQGNILRTFQVSPQPPGQGRVRGRRGGGSKRRLHRARSSGRRIHHGALPLRSYVHARHPVRGLAPTSSAGRHRGRGHRRLHRLRCFHALSHTGQRIEHHDAGALPGCRPRPGHPGRSQRRLLRGIQLDTGTRCGHCPHDAGWYLHHVPGLGLYQLHGDCLGSGQRGLTPPGVWRSRSGCRILFRGHGEPGRYPARRRLHGLPDPSLAGSRAKSLHLPARTGSMDISRGLSWRGGTGVRGGTLVHRCAAGSPPFRTDGESRSGSTTSPCSA